MMIRHRRPARLPLMLACVATALVVRVAARPASAAQEGSQKIVFAGAWQLNHELSTDTRQAAERGGEGREGRGGGMGGRPGGGMGGPPGGMGGRGGGGMGAPTGEERGGPGNSRDTQKMRELSRLVLEPSEQLLVTGNTDRVTLTYPDGRVLHYLVSGKSEKQTIEGVDVETKTTWSNADLVIETTTGGGIKATTTYSLKADTRQLIVTVKMEGGHSEQLSMPTAHYVYDAQDSR
jgi:hypothetical protein